MAMQTGDAPTCAMGRRGRGARLTGPLPHRLLPRSPSAGRRRRASGARPRPQSPEYRGPAHRRGPVARKTSTQQRRKLAPLFYCLEDQITHRRCTYTLCVALHATARRQGSVALTLLPAGRDAVMPMGVRFG